MTAAARPANNAPRQVAARAPQEIQPRGPVALIFGAVFTLIGSTLVSWFLGVLIEVAGIYYFWPEEAERHSADTVAESMGYIAAAPRSVVVGDTVQFSSALVDSVTNTYARLGVLRWYASTRGADSTPENAKGGALGRVKQVGTVASWHASRLAVVSMYVAQDTLLRLAVAMFALPAFVLACLLGVVDGLARRDLRRWGGGRESSFVYHAAKRWTFWSLTGGFTLYLSWPFGGFNPAYMVLIFTALVAMFLSTTLASFKKYL